MRWKTAENLNVKTSFFPSEILFIKLLLSNKKILLIDDITSSLDTKSISTIVKILKREKRDGKIIILSSNNSEFLLSAADSFIILEDNSVTINNNKYNLFSNKTLLDSIEMPMPDIVKFKNLAQNKGIKLMYRDNINDLIKDIYRNAK